MANRSKKSKGKRIDSKKRPGLTCYIFDSFEDADRFDREQSRAMTPRNGLEIVNGCDN
jgi:hypothetical protein